MNTRAFYSFAALKAFAFPLTLHFNAGMISAPGFPVSALLLESRRDTSLTLALRRFNCLCAVCLSLFGFQGSSPARPFPGIISGTVRIQYVYPFCQNRYFLWVYLYCFGLKLAIFITFLLFSGQVYVYFFNGKVTIFRHFCCFSELFEGYLYTLLKF